MLGKLLSFDEITPEDIASISIIREWIYKAIDFGNDVRLAFWRRYTPDLQVDRSNLNPVLVHVWIWKSSPDKGNRLFDAQGFGKLGEHGIKRRALVSRLLI